MNPVYISVASNIEPECNVAAALELLSGRLYIDGISTFYWNAALDRPEQPDYLNGVIACATGDDPRKLKFDVLRGIEAALGRQRGEDKFAPRTIDLDMLLYGSQVIDAPDLRVPDPEICKRPFLVAGLLELDPLLVLPGTGEAFETLPPALDFSELTPAAEFSRRMRERFTS